MGHDFTYSNDEDITFRHFYTTGLVGGFFSKKLMCDGITMVVQHNCGSGYWGHPDNRKHEEVRITVFHTGDDAKFKEECCSQMKKCKEICDSLNRERGDEMARRKIVKGIEQNRKDHIMSLCNCKYNNM